MDDSRQNAERLARTGQALMSATFFAFSLGVATVRIFGTVDLVEFLVR